MSRYPRRDTSAEVMLRRALHSLGLRFRLQHKVPGRNRRTIDIAFPRQRLAILVDGCFWHGCPEHGVMPKNNREWWRAKLETNRQRDEDTNERLLEAGWAVVRVWEHSDPTTVANQVRDLLAADTPRMEVTQL
ncbi:very short patch repair endonuclease [Enemella evansiae]|nr:very short patch repair endonuclease [Enemella evansiae]